VCFREQLVLDASPPFAIGLAGAERGQVHQEFVWRHRDSFRIDGSDAASQKEKENPRHPTPPDDGVSVRSRSRVRPRRFGRCCPRACGSARGGRRPWSASRRRAVTGRGAAGRAELDADVVELLLALADFAGFAEELLNVGPLFAREDSALAVCLIENALCLLR